MKYPKKYNNEKTEIKFPVFFESENTWFKCTLSKKGKLKKSSNTGYHKESHCWVTCNAYNKRVGYEEKEVKKIIKKYNKEKKDKSQNKSKKSS